MNFHLLKMKANLKVCDGCGELRLIWKNETEEGERKRYCKGCWSARKSKKHKPTLSNKPLRSRSPKRSKEETEYSKKAKAFKLLHPHCEIVVPGICTHQTHDVHHTQGREGTLLLDERYWKAGCRTCHQWVTVNTQEAIDLGYSLPRTK